MFRQLLFADTLRGFDSTGVFAVSDLDSLAEMYKKPYSAPDFLQMRQADDLIDTINEKGMMALVGHNRAATRGSVKEANAHPFQRDNITLVHNGTLISQSQLPSPKWDLDVDSDAVCYNIARHGIEETIKGLNGTYALVYHDAAAESIHIIRNEDRPLMIASLKHSDALIFASEEKMLRWILDRSGVEVGTFWTPKPGNLFNFKLTKKGKLDISHRPLEVYKSVSHGYPSQRYIAGSQQTPAKKEEKPAVTVSDVPRPIVPPRQNMKKQIPAEGSGAAKLAQGVGMAIGQHVLAYFESVWKPHPSSRAVTCTVECSTYSPEKAGFISFLVFGVPIKAAEDWEKVVGTYSAAVVRITDAYQRAIPGAEVSINKTADTETVLHGELVRIVMNHEAEKMERANFPGGMTQAAKRFEKSLELGDEQAEEDEAPFNSIMEEVDGLYHIGDGARANLKTWQKMTQDGCASCLGPLLEQHHKEITWIQGFPFCITCADDAHKQHDALK